MTTRNLRNGKSNQRTFATKMRGKGISHADGSFEFVPEAGLVGVRYTPLRQTRYGTLVRTEKSYKLSVLVPASHPDPVEAMSVTCEELIGALEIELKLNLSRA